MENFKSQIDEDIELIQRDYGSNDPRLDDPAFAFNYWVLSRIFSLDEDVIPPNITEYNDKNIDCFVHYEDTKELYIIQCKYYSTATAVTRDNVSDFLTTPLDVLKRGAYKRSQELQRIFDVTNVDPDYKIWLHFFVSNDYHNPDIESLFTNFNYDTHEISAFVGAKYYNLSDTKKLYFGDRFTNRINFTAIMPTIYSATSLDIRAKEYGMPWMIDLRYVFVNVVELYQIYKKAVKKNYELFEENIREYLGTQGINNGIIKTLKSPDDRENFFYYNNGITIICESCSTLNASSMPHEYKIYGYNYGFKLANPQIVNGCQTINSIAEVLSHYNDEIIHKEFEKSFVLVKIFVFSEETKKSKVGLDENIVRFTNSQNAISDKAFASKKDYFLNIQEEFFKRGYLLLVKPSDKNKFSEKHNNTVELRKLQEKASFFNERLDVSTTKLSDYMIPLEKLLKALYSFKEDGYATFTKGTSVLKKTSHVYKNFSLQIDSWLSIDNMLLLYLVYDKAEKDKKRGDKRYPIPYYVLGFMGAACKEKRFDELKHQLDFLFSSRDIFLPVYNFYKILTQTYAEDYNGLKSADYGIMVKQEIDQHLFEKCFNSALRFYADAQKVTDFININNR